MSDSTRSRRALRRCLLLAAAGWMLFAGAWLASGRHPHFAPPAPPSGSERHYVSPQQLLASGEASGRPCPDLTTFAATPAERDRPLVVVFIKRDCPCSVEFQPSFDRLARALPFSTFLGIIDAPQEVADAYRDARATPFPIIGDPDQKLIGDFAAQNGAYVALVRAGGVIEALWPGWNRSNADELCRRAARLAGAAAPAIDVTDLPSAMTTGCPYEEIPPR